MRRLLFPLLTFLLLQTTHAQIISETTGTTQGLWQTGTNGRGETFVVGNNGTILRKSTACSNWETIPVPVTNGLRAVTFIQDSIGIAVGVSGTIFRSTNWGANWSLISAPSSAGLLGVININDSVLLATGGGSSGNVVIRSSDLGLTWNIQTSLLNGSGFDFAQVNDSTIFVVGVSGTVQRSNDFGLSWNPVGALSGTLMSVAFANENIGVIAGQGGAIHRTTDGGTTWTQITTPITSTLNRAVAFSATHLIAVGLSGVVIESQDAGLTWSTYTTGITTALRVLGKNNGGFFAAGNSGVLFRFTPNPGYTTLFAENFCSFTDSVAVPTGWSNVAHNTTGHVWRFDNPAPAPQANNQVLEAPFATFNANFYNSATADSATLTTPIFSTIGHNQVSVRWDEVFIPQAAGSTQTTIDAFNGTSWQRVYASNGGRNQAGYQTIQTISNGAVQAKRSIDISSLGNSSQVQLRFTFSGSGSGRNSWAIDNIEVISSPTDVAVDSIFASNNSCSLPVTDQPQVAVKNNSLFDVAPIQLAYSINNGTPAYAFFPQGLRAGQTAVVNLASNGVTIAAPGQLRVWWTGNFDGTSSNDTLNYTYNNTGGPVIGFNADTIPLCDSATVTLRSPILSGASYQWSGAGTGILDSLVVSTPGWYYLELTQNGCTSRDSLFVEGVPIATNQLAGLADTLFTNQALVLLAPADGPGRYQIFDNGTLVFDTVIANNITPVLAPGTYRIVFMVERQGCVSTFEKNLWIVSGIGVENLEAANFTVYPNPFSDNIFVALPEGSHQIMVRNTMGQTLFIKRTSEPLVPIQTTHWAHGVYFVEVQSATHKVQVQKIIK